MEPTPLGKIFNFFMSCCFKALSLARLCGVKGYDLRMVDLKAFGEKWSWPDRCAISGGGTQETHDVPELVQPKYVTTMSAPSINLLSFRVFI
jgi:hypothetical protein